MFLSGKTQFCENQFPRNELILLIRELSSIKAREISRNFLTRNFLTLKYWRIDKSVWLRKLRFSFWLKTVQSNFLLAKIAGFLIFFQKFNDWIITEFSPQKFAKIKTVKWSEKKLKPILLVSNDIRSQFNQSVFLIFFLDENHAVIQKLPNTSWVFENRVY